jgi:ribosomal protein S18 acetylase RimI-like enzyme
VNLKTSCEHRWDDASFHASSRAREGHKREQRYLQRRQRIERRLSGVGHPAPKALPEVHLIRRAQLEDLETVRGFLREYADSLGVDLSFQDFESELADPLSSYELVLLAEDGCVALRGIDELTCEMKRLYVRPVARGGGLGRQLAEEVIAEARARGYGRMLLDTLPEMSAAQALYRSLGFRETEPYRLNPVPGAAFLELEL